MKSVFIFLSVVLLTACGVSLVVPTQADVNRVSAKFSDYSLTELRDGKKIFEKQCTVCHGLKDPKSLGAAKWKLIVPEMCNKANRKAGKEVINAEQQEKLLRYLLTMGPEITGRK